MEENSKQKDDLKWIKTAQAYYFCANKYADEKDSISVNLCLEKMKYINWQIKTKSPFNPGYLDDFLLKPYGGKERLLEEISDNSNIVNINNKIK